MIWAPHVSTNGMHPNACLPFRYMTWNMLNKIFTASWGYRLLANCWAARIVTCIESSTTIE